MTTRVFLVCLAIFAGAVQCQVPTKDPYSEFICHRLENEVCTSHKVDERCGSDNVTYRNGCELGKAYCANDHIHQAHKGPCTNDPHATRSTEEVKHASEIMHEFECIYLSHRSCEPAVNEKVCGTDGYTYPSFCEYQKAKCTHMDLHVAKIGDCTTNKFYYPTIYACCTILIISYICIHNGETARNSRVWINKHTSIKRSRLTSVGKHWITSGLSVVKNIQ
ncbi:agrin-like [Mercenaria mercenaria]|uniref:agrin-like n=1 Tax=Mercenaria mercenaria TaxID=6596 RepID=UPI00234FA1C6|nr:agrin-like [Mercenaria mercenaria]